MALGFTIEECANGKFKVTYNLRTVWIDRAEAEAIANGDRKKGAALLRRLERLAR